MQAVKTALKLLKDGDKLLMFPEGTRVRQGEDVSVKTGAAMFATRTGVPLLPVYIQRKKRLFARNAVVIGQPYYPQYAGRKPTPEELAVHHRGGDGPGPALGEGSGERGVSQIAGFCYGVRRAVELAERTAEQGRPCVMLGSIIHNQEVIARLAERGLSSVEPPEEVPEGSAVIIRSHGEGRVVYELLRGGGAEILDATCPNVTRIHEIVARRRKRGVSR